MYLFVYCLILNRWKKVNNDDERQPGLFIQMQIIYFDTKSSEKSKHWWPQPGLFDKKKNRKFTNIPPSLHFYGMIILVKTKPLWWGMAWLPFQKQLFISCFKQSLKVNRPLPPPFCPQTLSTPRKCYNFNTFKMLI